MPLQRFSERADANGPTLLEDEKMQLEERGCGISVLGGEIVPGNLYLTTKRLIWLGAERDLGFAVDYPYIGLHALSRDLDAFPKCCIYCHLQSAAGLEELTGSIPPSKVPVEEDEAETGAEDYSVDAGCEPPGEVRFVPSDEGSLEKIFRVMTDMAALNPDVADSDSDDASDMMAAMMGEGHPAVGQNIWNPAEEEFEDDDEGAE